MKKALILICCLLSFFSCKEKKEAYDVNFLTPYVYEGASSVFIVIPVGLDSYICIYNDVLRDVVYVDHYQQDYDNYLSFLQALFNKPKDIDIIQYLNNDSVFEVAESNVWHEYEKEGFAYIMNKYIIDSSHDNLVTNLTERKDILAIVKTMFDNNYFVFFDDNNPHFYFSKKNTPIIIEDQSL